jgi:hypothetical protein
MAGEFCIWTMTPCGDYYEATCGLLWEFPDSHTPMEHGMRFCCRCGNPLVSLVVESADDEEEAEDAP